MDFDVFVTSDAKEDLEGFIYYLLVEKKSGSIKICDNPRLKALGYRRINFLSHRYFMLFRIEGNQVIVDHIFHELQDYERKMF